VQPTRNGANFLSFPEEAVRPHAGLSGTSCCDNLSTHPTPEVMAWLERTRRCTFNFTLAARPGSNHIRDLFGIITRRPSRRGTSHLGTFLIKPNSEVLDHWNTTPAVVWTATC